MLIAPKPGLMFDQPAVAAGEFWNIGVNVRFRLGLIETVGLHGPLLDAAGNPIVLPGPGVYRKLYTTPSTTTGQILAASSADVRLVEYDPNSLPVDGTRWRTFDVTPSPLTAIADTLPNPSAGRVEIPPVWWFSDQDDVVVGSRAGGLSEPVYSWDRQNGVRFAPLANSPLGAVGGGINNRILVLLGCTSFTDPDPRRFMTVRWSDRFNFESWTPSDLNVSGELQLEGGSRIVGGGVTGFGVVVWTDRRMALLSESGNIETVFSRRYIDGGRGMLANNSWCEADGRVWWMDESRVLNVFDGGRPRQIPNPMKYATIERLEDRQTARIYMQPNPEYGEVIIFIPDRDAENPDAQIVYNYNEDCWTYWQFQRTGWSSRFGVIPSLGIDVAGGIFRHDLDIGLPSDFISGPGLPGPISQPFPTAGNRPSAAHVTPFDFQFHTNLITTGNVTEKVWRMTRVHADHLPVPCDGSEADEFTVVLTGYGDAQVRSDKVQDDQQFQQGQNARDFRVGGKALQISVFGQQVKSLFRWSGFNVTPAEGGQR